MDQKRKAKKRYRPYMPFLRHEHNILCIAHNFQLCEISFDSSVYFSAPSFSAVPTSFAVG